MVSRPILLSPKPLASYIKTRGCVAANPFTSTATAIEAVVRPWIKAKDSDKEIQKSFIYLSYLFQIKTLTLHPNLPLHCSEQ